MSQSLGLMQRLKSGEYVIIAEGYLFEFERRGYLKGGAFVPEVVLEHPDLVQSMHEEFVHSGSDVVQAFTYYGHREKLKLVGREGDLEKLNRNALRIARKVADETGTLMAGNISNTTVYTPGDPGSEDTCRSIFKEQIIWAVEEKADFIIGETFSSFGEAKIALECIKKYAPGLPAVITMCVDNNGQTYDGLDVTDAMVKLEDLGADVVGLNCRRGPDSILPLIKAVREKCKGPVACIPVPYRTSEEAKAMQDLRDQRTGERSFPIDLDTWLCSRGHIADFTEEMKKLGVQYIGVCCGNRAHYIRAMAEALGRKPPASKYSTDMSQHFSQLKSSSHEYSNKTWHATFPK